MTLTQFAETIISDPIYRDGVIRRAREGSLPPDVELLLLELADGRPPMSVGRAVAAPDPARTLTLVRPSAIDEEVQS